MNTLALLCIIYDVRSVIYHIRYFCLKHTSPIHLRVSSYIPFNRLCLFNCLYIAFYLICLYLPHVTSYSTNRMWYPFLKLSHLTLVSQAYLTREIIVLFTACDITVSPIACGICILNILCTTFHYILYSIYSNYI